MTLESDLNPMLRALNKKEMNAFVVTWNEVRERGNTGRCFIPWDTILQAGGAWPDPLTDCSGFPCIRDDPGYNNSSDTCDGESIATACSEALANYFALTYGGAYSNCTQICALYGKTDCGTFCYDGGLIGGPGCEEGHLYWAGCCCES